MKFRAAVSALALSFALVNAAAPVAMAQEQFRSVEAQSFSQADLQAYGLSEADATEVHALQEQGYQVQLITPEEAAQYQAGQFTNSQWLVIGIIVLVVAVAAAA